jgi:chromosome segregation ATPase
MLLVLMAGTVHAQEDRGQQALARAQALLRQVSAQKQELEAANARLTAQLAALESRLGSAEARLKETSLNLQSQQRKAERTGGALESTQERLGRTETTLRDANDKLRAANAGLREQQQAAAELKTRLEKAEADVADSERKNLQLYQANVELVAMYRNKGPLTALMHKEPVTGIKRVGLENTLQEYQFKLDDALTERNRKAVREGEAGETADE